MTVICHDVQTKNALKRLIKSAPGVVMFTDPAIVNPAHDGRRFSAIEMNVGERITCTNHPKRSWYSTIERTTRGWKVS